MNVAADTKVGIAVFVTTCAIFLASHVHQIADSNYSMLLSQSLVEHGTFALDAYVIPDLEEGHVGGTGRLYQLERVLGHTYYWYPPGASILSVPYVALMNRFGISAANADRTYNPQGEKAIETRLAALLMAGLSCLVFFTARRLLPLGWSVVIALGTACGTQVWSTASRGLWSDTWGIFLLGFVVWMLAAHETGGPALRPVVLASLLSWTYFVKPTYSVPIIGVSIYVLLFHRPRFPAYVATGVVWAAGFVAYSWYHFGALLPSYYYLASWMDVATLRRGLLVNLTSPSRGLLVYVPVLVFVVYVLVRYMRDLPLRRLVVLSACIVVGHLVAISGFPIWWAGFCYGPRFSTGLVPWFALFPIIAIAARQRSAALPSRWRTAELVVGGILLAASITLNGIGANVGRTAQWNVEPVSVDVQPERVLDWRDPQFLR